MNISRYDNRNKFIFYKGNGIHYLKLAHQPYMGGSGWEQGQMVAKGAGIGKFYFFKCRFQSGAIFPGLEGFRAIKPFEAPFRDCHHLAFFYEVIQYGLGIIGFFLCVIQNKKAYKYTEKKQERNYRFGSQFGEPTKQASLPFEWNRCGFALAGTYCRSTFDRFSIFRHRVFT